MEINMISVGETLPPISKNMEKYKKFNGAKLEVDSDGNYFMYVFIDGMTKNEEEALKNKKITFKVIEEEEYEFLLTLVGISDDLQFEIIFDPTLYKSNKVGIARFKKSNFITLVGVDTRNMIVKACRIFTIPDHLRKIWLDSWEKMIGIEYCNFIYMNWVSNLYQYPLKRLWEIGKYISKVGE